MTNPNAIQMERYVEGLTFPASRDDLVRQASERGADEQVVNTLRKLPDIEYDGPNAVSNALSGTSDAMPRDGQQSRQGIQPSE